MPYGFIKHLEKRGFSQVTLIGYEKVMGQFFSYLAKLYPEKKEPFQISSKDIKDYIRAQEEKEKSPSTINKELAIIKSFFNYLWEIDKVPVDPAVKIKRLKAKKLVELNTFYEELNSLLDPILTHKDYPIVRKAIYVLALKGLKYSDFLFKKDNVLISNTQDQVEIVLENRTILLSGQEASIFIEFYNQSLFNSSDFVFTSKIYLKRKNDFGNLENYGPIQLMTILNHLKVISSDFNLGENLTLTIFRKSIAYFMYTKQRESLHSIAYKLGIEENTALIYLKLITESTAEKTY
ncbi:MULTISPECIES: tyrosine-type recombinase/integrase [Niallia]|uniref:Integrase n=1 Tax=Niallia taxi TaxID=2499688 RepID=A0A437K7F1_9BACI|nr:MULTISPECIES: site-specific integrase [Niallia]MDK8642440.1 site-specific integrase [Niallia taxi]MED4040582.1 site-specific integrase [Niallia taxi]MED4057022.1 site-specific integrase [Niallia taxi]MED4121632.1 site-specific integrase [Niallia taxi]RVT59533.1 integrase [Niallia taxi]